MDKKQTQESEQEQLQETEQGQDYGPEPESPDKQNDKSNDKELDKDNNNRKKNERINRVGFFLSFQKCILSLFLVLVLLWLFGWDTDCGKTRCMSNTQIVLMFQEGFDGKSMFGNGWGS